MVQFYRNVSTYPDPPAQALLAFFIRYPNPFARHVLSVDVLERYIDTEGRLHTKRLILKRGILPKWASRWLPMASMSGGRGLDAWVLEDSVVDPPGRGESSTSSSSNTLANSTEGGGYEASGSRGPGERTYGQMPRLRMSQGNLNHRKFMHVVEGGELRAAPDGTTEHITTAEIRSNFGGSWSRMIRERIESHGAGRLAKNTEKARQGMSLILYLMRNHQPSPDTMEFYPPPPPSFGEAWPVDPSLAATFAERQSTGGFWNRWKRKEEGGDDEDDDDD